MKPNRLIFQVATREEINRQREEQNKILAQKRGTTTVQETPQQDPLKFGERILETPTPTLELPKGLPEKIAATETSTRITAEEALAPLTPEQRRAFAGFGTGPTTQEQATVAQQEVDAKTRAMMKERAKAVERAQMNVGAPLRTSFFQTPEGPTSTVTSLQNLDPFIRRAIDQAVAADPDLNRSLQKLRKSEARVDLLRERAKTESERELVSTLEEQNQAIAYELGRRFEGADPAATIDSFIEDIGIEGLGQLSIDGLTNFVNKTAASAGVDPTQLLQTTLAKQALAKEIAATKDEDVKAGLLATFNQMGIAPSADIQKAGALELLQNQLSDGEITQEQFDSRSAALLGDIEKQKSVGGVSLPKGEYDYEIIPAGNGGSEGVRINVDNNVQGGQCGYFVNTILGKPNFFGDSFVDKASKVNTYTPVAGAAFIMDTRQPYGHTGIVERVYADGTIDIVESNWGLDEKVSRRRIDPVSAGIVGYYDPSEGSLKVGDQYTLDTLTARLGKQIYGTRISDKESERVERFLKEGAKLGKTEYDIIDDLTGFKPQKNKELGEILRDKLLEYSGEGGLTGFDMLGLARLLNSDKTGEAVNKVEKIILEPSDDGIPRETAAIYAQNKGDEIIEKINTNLNKLGIVVGKYEKLKSKFTESKEFTRISADLTALQAEWREKIAGANVTKDEEKFLANILADVENNPFNAIEKIRAFQKMNLDQTNSVRDNYNLPSLAVDSLLNKNNRVFLYTTSDIFRQSFNFALGDKTINDFTNYIKSVDNDLNGSTDDLNTWLNTLDF